VLAGDRVRRISERHCSDLKMPSVRELITDGNHDARWLARFEDDYD
jgi:hypothetical protein